MRQTIKATKCLKHSWNAFLCAPMSPRWIFISYLVTRNNAEPLSLIASSMISIQSLMDLWLMWTNSTIVGRKSGLQASNQGGEDKSFFFHQKLTVRLHTILVFLHIIFVFVYVFFLPWTLDNVCLLVGYYSNIDCTGNPSIRVFFVFLFFVCICLYLFVFLYSCLFGNDILAVRWDSHG